MILQMLQRCRAALVALRQKPLAGGAAIAAVGLCWGIQRIFHYWP